MPYLTIPEPDGGADAIKVMLNTMEEEGYSFVTIRQGWATYEPVFKIPKNVPPVYIFYRE